MDFLSKVLSNNSRAKERAKKAEDLNWAFKDNLDTVKKIVEKEGSEVRSLIDMIYDSSFPEEQVFLKAPSRAKLKFKKDLVSRLLSALDSQGVPVMGMMLDVVRKQGMDSISDTIITLLELLAPLFESKVAPEFSTDDVLDAMDVEWHTPSNTASPLLTAFASRTSSPRLSAASASESPMQRFGFFRRAFSDRSTFDPLSQHELVSKSNSDKAAPSDSYSGTATPRFSHSASDRYIEGTQMAVPEKIGKRAPYRLGLATQEEEVPGKLHRRKSSSLRELLAEDSDLLLAVAEVAAKDTRGVIEKGKSRLRASLDFSSGSSTAKRRSTPRMSLDFSGKSGKSKSSRPARASSTGHPSRAILSDHSNRGSPGDASKIDYANLEERVLQKRLSLSSSEALWRQASDGYSVNFMGDPNSRTAQPTLSSSADRSDYANTGPLDHDSELASHTLYQDNRSDDLTLPGATNSNESSDQVVNYLQGKSRIDERSESPATGPSDHNDEQSEDRILPGTANSNDVGGEVVNVLSESRKDERSELPPMGPSFSQNSEFAPLATFSEDDASLNFAQGDLSEDLILPVASTSSNEVSGEVVNFPAESKDASSHIAPGLANSIEETNGKEPNLLKESELVSSEPMLDTGHENAANDSDESACVAGSSDMRPDSVRNPVLSSSSRSISGKSSSSSSEKLQGYDSGGVRLDGLQADASFSECDAADRKFDCEVKDTNEKSEDLSDDSPCLNQMSMQESHGNELPHADTIDGEAARQTPDLRPDTELDDHAEARGCIKEDVPKQQHSLTEEPSTAVQSQCLNREREASPVDVPTPVVQSEHLIGGNQLKDSEINLSSLAAQSVEEDNPDERNLEESSDKNIEDKPTTDPEIEDSAAAVAQMTPEAEPEECFLNSESALFPPASKLDNSRSQLLETNEPEREGFYSDLVDLPALACLEKHYLDGQNSHQAIEAITLPEVRSPAKELLASDDIPGSSSLGVVQDANTSSMEELEHEPVAGLAQDAKTCSMDDLEHEPVASPSVTYDSPLSIRQSGEAEPNDRSLKSGSDLLPASGSDLLPACASLKEDLNDDMNPQYGEASDKNVDDELTGPDIAAAVRMTPEAEPEDRLLKSESALSPPSMDGLEHERLERLAQHAEACSMDLEHEPVVSRPVMDDSPISIRQPGEAEPNDQILKSGFDLLPAYASLKEDLNHVMDPQYGETSGKNIEDEPITGPDIEDSAAAVKTTPDAEHEPVASPSVTYDSPHSLRQPGEAEPNDRSLKSGSDVLPTCASLKEDLNDDMNPQYGETSDKNIDDELTGPDIAAAVRMTPEAGPEDRLLNSESALCPRSMEGLEQELFERLAQDTETCSMEDLEHEPVVRPPVMDDSPISNRQPGEAEPNDQILKSGIDLLPANAPLMEDLNHDMDPQYGETSGKNIENDLITGPDFEDSAAAVKTTPDAKLEDRLLTESPLSPPASKLDNSRSQLREANEPEREGFHSDLVDLPASVFLEKHHLDGQNSHQAVEDPALPEVRSPAKELLDGDDIPGSSSLGVVQDAKTGNMEDLEHEPVASPAQDAKTCSMEDLEHESVASLAQDAKTRSMEDLEEEPVATPPLMDVSPISIRQTGEAEPNVQILKSGSDLLPACATWKEDSERPNFESGTMEVKDVTQHDSERDHNDDTDRPEEVSVASALPQCPIDRKDNQPREPDVQLLLPTAEIESPVDVKDVMQLDSERDHSDDKARSEDVSAASTLPQCPIDGKENEPRDPDVQLLLPTAEIESPVDVKDVTQHDSERDLNDEEVRPEDVYAASALPQCPIDGKENQPRDGVGEACTSGRSTGEGDHMDEPVCRSIEDDASSPSPESSDIPEDQVPLPDSKVEPSTTATYPIDELYLPKPRDTEIDLDIIESGLQDGHTVMREDVEAERTPAQSQPEDQVPLPGSKVEPSTTATYPIDELYLPKPRDTEIDSNIIESGLQDGHTVMREDVEAERTPAQSQSETEMEERELLPSESKENPSVQQEGSYSKWNFESVIDSVVNYLGLEGRSPANETEGPQFNNETEGPQLLDSESKQSIPVAQFDGDLYPNHSEEIGSSLHDSGLQDVHSPRNEDHNVAEPIPDPDRMDSSSGAAESQFNCEMDRPDVLDSESKHLPPVTQILDDELHPKPLNEEIDSGAKDMGMKVAQFPGNEDNVQASGTRMDSPTGAAQPQLNSEMENTELLDSDWKQSPSFAQSEDELNPTSLNSEENDLGVNDLGLQDVHLDSGERDPKAKLIADSAQMKSPPGDAVQPQLSNVIEKCELLDSGLKPVPAAAQVQDYDLRKESSKDVDANIHDVAAEQGVSSSEKENYEGECAVARVQDYDLRKESSKDVDASIHDVAAEQDVSSSEKENSEGERDVAQVEDSFTSGIDKSNPIAAEKSKVEPQRYEDGVVGMQGGKFPAKEDFDEKPIESFVSQSGNEVEEQDSESVPVSWSESDESKTEIARDFRAGIDDASMQHIETPVDSTEGGSNEDTFDQKQNFAVDQSTDRLSDKDSSTVPDDRPGEEENCGSLVNLRPQESVGEVNCRFSEHPPDNSGCEAIENCVGDDGRDEVGQASDERPTIECRAIDGQEYDSSSMRHLPPLEEKESSIGQNDSSKGSSSLELPAVEDSEVRKVSSGAARPDVRLEEEQDTSATTASAGQEVKASQQQEGDEATKTEEDEANAHKTDDGDYPSSKLWHLSNSGKFDTKPPSNSDVREHAFDQNNPLLSDKDAPDEMSRSKAGNILGKVRRRLCCAHLSTKA